MLKVSVISPEQTLFDGEAESVVPSYRMASGEITETVSII